MALVLEALDVGRLVLGEHLGEVAVQAEVAGHAPGAGLGVARDHDEVREAERAQVAQDASRLGARRVADADAAKKGLVLCNKDRGRCPCLARQELVEAVGLLYTLVLKEEVGAADAHLVAIDTGGDAVRDDIADLGVELAVVREPARLGLGHDGAGHAVREVLLNAGREAQKLVLGCLGAADHARHGRSGVGEGARLVEDDGVGRGKRLEVLAAAHGHAEAGGLVHRAHHGERRRELDGARVVDHEHGHGLVDVAREREDAEEGQEAVGHKAVRQALGARLDARLELTGLLHEGDDVVDARAARRRRDAHLEVAVRKRGSGEHGGALLLAHGGALPRH